MESIYDVVNRFLDSIKEVNMGLYIFACIIAVILVLCIAEGIILSFHFLIKKIKNIMSKYKAPRITFSKKECICDETGATILAGQDCLIDQEKGKAYHMNSPKFKSFQK